MNLNSMLLILIVDNILIFYQYENHTTPSDFNNYFLIYILLNIHEVVLLLYFASYILVTRRIAENVRLNNHLTEIVIWRNGRLGDTYKHRLVFVVLQ